MGRLIIQPISVLVTIYTETKTLVSLHVFSNLFNCCNLRKYLMPFLQQLSIHDLAKIRSHNHTLIHTTPRQVRHCSLSIFFKYIFNVSQSYSTFHQLYFNLQDRLRLNFLFRKTINNNNVFSLQSCGVFRFITNASSVAVIYFLRRIQRAPPNGNSLKTNIF